MLRIPVGPVNPNDAEAQALLHRVRELLDPCDGGCGEGAGGVAHLPQVEGGDLPSRK